jgi:GT2 family glycosyltransferase
LLISVIIPNRNGSGTLARCLEAAFASRDPNFEVVVVDDASSDRSADIIGRFPCRLIRLGRHHGAAGARNVGAAHSRGELLFFTDADCLLLENSLCAARGALSAGDAGTVAGGTYTLVPGDDSFFSRFQSVFIHHSETRRAGDPDYVATHALAIRAETFRRHGGFAEGPLPILEDVELSHRLRRAGCTLLVDPAIQVRHIFNFNLYRSLRNARVKAKYWTLYSLRNRDLLADSGAASHGLKANVAAFLLWTLCAGTYFVTTAPAWLGFALALLAGAMFANRGLLGAFRAAGGRAFAVRAALYYFFVYPLPVGLGALGGAALFLAGSLPDPAFGSTAKAEPPEDLR